MKVCVIGYGAMGKVLAETLGEDLACVVSLETSHQKISDYKEKIDCIIDFSNPSSLDMICDYARDHQTPVVFATTGYSQQELEKINNLAKQVSVLKSDNFSLGVILLNKLVKEITPILKDDFDIEIVEAHHKHKVDAPSGTAKMFLDSVIEATDYEASFGRGDGYAPRKEKEVGVHSIRGGEVVGTHEVMYFGDHEIITLKHVAESKKIFATGAIKAAQFLVQQPVGFYNMEDVLFGK